MSARAVLLVDYGSGNLLSVRRALEHVGAAVELSDSPKAIERAERLLLPGVGAFGDCMAELRGRRLVEPLQAYAASGRPFLGICVGMQILFEESEEFGRYPGLGLLSGRVAAIPASGTDGRRHKIPHIGWAPLKRPETRTSWSGGLLTDVEDGMHAYFVHSFTAVPTESADRLADTDYDGCTISAAVSRKNVTGMQFHPEKSGPLGLTILRRFIA